MHEDEQQFLESLPDELQVQLRAWAAEFSDAIMWPGFPELRLLSECVWGKDSMRRRNMVHLFRAVKERWAEWSTFQALLADQAQALTEKLHTVAPLPTQEQVMNNTAVFPTWLGTTWAIQLSNPWCEQLQQAVLSAEIWIEAHEQLEGMSKA